MQANTLPKALIDITGKQPDRIALRMKEYGIWRDITWRQYLENVRRTALGLHHIGVKRGDHVAIIGENKPEWLYSAFGVMSLGATFVGVYTTNPPKECEYVIDHSDSVVFICEDEEQMNKAFLFRMNTPNLKKIIVWDMEGLRDLDDPMVISFDEIMEIGGKADEENPTLFDRFVGEGNPRDIAGIIYTSGTTGPPKGAMLNHEGYLWVGEQAAKITQAGREDESISFLPLNHVYEQIFDLMMHMTVGHIVNFTENTDTVMNDMMDVSPTIFHAVPRIWEKYYSAIVLKMADATWFKRTAYGQAVRIGSKYNDLRLAGRKIPLPLYVGYHLAYFCVFRKLKERLGFDRTRLGFSGAAPISHDIIKFFQSIGIPIREGYGMTETTGVTHMGSEFEF
ncbi:MAG TPA: AMP-binding protein, partial [Deltaproteobacteria bacterium]|nr:AMP-binding protein [Deltaproteobacteria bacterium]